MSNQIFQNSITSIVDSIDALNLADGNNIPPPPPLNLSSSTSSKSLATPLLSESNTQVVKKTGDGITRPSAVQAVNQLQNAHDLALLSAIETLLDLPLSPRTKAKEPVASDIAIFKQELQVLRPSDYDDLIEERNIDLRCGYALCPASLPKSKLASKGKLRILTSATGKGRVVQQQILDRFCGEDCARRALYVRVQLDEMPGWLRGQGESTATEDRIDVNASDNEITLMGEVPKSSLDLAKSQMMKKDEANVLEQLSKLGIDNVNVEIKDQFRSNNS